MKLAKRMDNIKASEIRELLALTQKPDIISFAGGLPAKESFPVKAFEEAAKRVIESSGDVALQYTTTEGNVKLRGHITKRLVKLGVKATEDNIIITSGSQQGLDFTAKIFIDKGDVIICEAPTYLGAINAFRPYEPKFVDVETDENGMRMDKLEEALKANPDAKFIYAIADFQNPTGKTLPKDRRKRLVELAREYDVMVLEDNPYGELRFEGEIQPAIQSFDTDGRVMFLGTFSKILAPGLRLGWVCASPEVINKFNLIKQGSDLQSSTISQMEVADLLDNMDIEEHIKTVSKMYAKRRDAMLKTMEEEFPKEIKWTHPEGGLFLWVELPEKLSARDVAKEALKEKVAYVPGGAFFANGGHENTFRMNYSNSSEEKIVEGIKRLAKVLKKMV